MPLPAMPVSGEITGSYDTVANTWQTSGLADVSLGNFALHADAFDRDAGDYDTPLPPRSTNRRIAAGVADVLEVRLEREMIDDLVRISDFEPGFAVSERRAGCRRSATVFVADVGAVLSV